MRRVDSLGRLWCWEGLGAGGERDDRGWDGWAASPTRWTWVWVNSGSWWWTGRPGVLRFMGSQRVGHDWATELNWRQLKSKDKLPERSYSGKRLQKPAQRSPWAAGKSRTALNWANCFEAQQGQLLGAAGLNTMGGQADQKILELWPAREGNSTEYTQSIQGDDPRQARAKGHPGVNTLRSYPWKKGTDATSPIKRNILKAAKDGGGS